MAQLTGLHIIQTWSHLGKFQYVLPIGWQSATIERVVRSTLGAEAYATSEATESWIWIAQLLTEFCLERGDSRKCKASEDAADKRGIVVLTDSDIIFKTVLSDKRQAMIKGFGSSYRH